jgi:hypothetical protein
MFFLDVFPWLVSSLPPIGCLAAGNARSGSSHKQMIIAAHLLYNSRIIERTFWRMKRIDHCTIGEMLAQAAREFMKGGEWNVLGKRTGSKLYTDLSFAK